MQQVQDALTAAWNWAYAFFVAHPVFGMQLLIGLVAGWLASLLLGGKGLLRDLIIGMLGSVVGSYIQMVSGYHIANVPALIEQIAVATLGALLVIIIGRVVFR
jgi:uncharacterized membrane protein YeaQ/YmgE (transglycosylase-associated protein family)